VKKTAKRNSVHLGLFVRRIRKEKRLSLADVSKQSALFGTRISTSYINRIEKDPKRKPTVATLKALAHGLGIPVAELLEHSVRNMSRDESDELSLRTRFRELSQQRKSDVWALIELWHAGDSP
jgi:transcriptional regulator with XRE-family HTH domain